MKIICTYRESNSYASRYFDRQEGYHYLMEADGDRLETGLYLHEMQGKKQAVAVDVSCMIGCPLHCFFCESARLGYKRNLSAEEIAEEVSLALAQHDHAAYPLLALSFQGIGEPALNAANIIEASRRLRELYASCVFNVSTTGCDMEAVVGMARSGVRWGTLQISITKDSAEGFAETPGIIRFIRERELPACFEYLKFNYVLVAGVNDTEAHLERLVELFAGTGFTLKLARLNSRTERLRPTDDSTAAHFSAVLAENGIDNYRFGACTQSSIGCGQLVYLNEDPD